MAPEQHSEKIDNMIGRAFGSCAIQQKIAVGGFGTVYKALDIKLNVFRAIKIFHAHLSEEKGFRKRFEIEMRLLALLDHPNIVRITTAIDEADASGFIMEFVEGETLSDIIEKQGALPIPKAIDIFMQVARAIAYAHNLKNQIIHRDLSPDNIMIRTDGVVKIMDFGIAKTIGSERVTQTGIVLGKPTYMAPEQFEGTVSIYTDQYALGIILYEMLTGKVPFDAESPIALYKLHLNEPPPSPREVSDKVPPHVESVILKALAKDEKNRFKSMDELLDMLVSSGQKGAAIDNKVPSLMLEIENAIKQEDFDKALELVSEVLRYDPENKEAAAKKEDILKLQKSHQDQDMIEEWFHQAQAFYESNMEDETCNTIIDLLKMASQYPNSKTVKRYQDSLQKKMPEIYDTAKTILDKEWERMEELTHKGKVLFQKDMFAEAQKYFDDALLIVPYNENVQKLRALTQKKIKMAQVAAHYRDGIVALKNEEYDKAVDAFDKVLQLHPQHKDAKKYLEMAHAELERIHRSRSELEATYREALTFYEKWEFTLAIEKFKRVLEMDQQHEEARRFLHETQARVDDENKIEEIGFFYNQGLTFYKSQQWEKAITCFNRVLKYMDNHKGAHEYLELAEEKLQQQKQIEETFQQSLEYFRNSQYTEALKRLDFILSIDKNHKGARQYRTLCEELQGLADETSGLTMPDSPHTSLIEETLQVAPPARSGDKKEVSDETDDDLVDGASE